MFEDVLPLKFFIEYIQETGGDVEHALVSLGNYTMKDYVLREDLGFYCSDIPALEKEFEEFMEKEGVDLCPRSELDHGRFILALMNFAAAKDLAGPRLSRGRFMKAIVHHYVNEAFMFEHKGVILPHL